MSRADLELYEVDLCRDIARRHALTWRDYLTLLDTHLARALAQVPS